MSEKPVTIVDDWRKFSTNLGEADAEIAKANDRKHLALRRRGWSYSSDYPDSCWRYSKEIDGKPFMTGSLARASEVELTLCNREALAEKEENDDEKS